MRRLTPLLLLLGLLLSLGACQRSNTEISGKIEGQENGSLVVELFDLMETSLIDSLETTQDGSFKIRFNLEEPMLVLVTSEDGQVVTLLAQPGEKMTLKAKAGNMGSQYTVSGSPGSEEILILNRQLDLTRSRMDSLQVLAEGIEDTESEEMKELSQAYAGVVVTQKRFTIEYLVRHMHDLPAIYALYQRFDPEILVLNLDTDLQYFKTVSDSLAAAHGEIQLVKVVREDVERREKQIRREQSLEQLMELAGPESGILDLNITDRDGKEIQLSSLNGKPVLIMFWASADENSVNALLGLKASYERYHSKGFEIYAVSMDSDKLTWMNSVDFNEFNWINVCELSYPESRAAMLYNVQALPTNFLLNKEGDILVRDIYGRQLETWLDNLL